MVRWSNNFAAEIRAVAAAGGDVAREALVQALLDPRPRVAREARRALARSFVVPRERLLRLYSIVRQPHTRTQVLALLARGERGASMVSLVEAAVVSDEAMLPQVCEHLRRWLDEWAPLPPRAVRALAEAFGEAKGVLPVAVAERLRGYIRELEGAPRTRPVWRQQPSRRSVKPRSRGGFLQGRVVRRSYELVPSLLAQTRGVLHL